MMERIIMAIVGAIFIVIAYLIGLNQNRKEKEYYQKQYEYYRNEYFHLKNEYFHLKRRNINYKQSIGGNIDE